ncbi:MAG: argininosuccinate lyase [Terriglobia bacterium]
MKAWDGRFKKETNELVEKFTSSIHFDGRLYAEDIRGSIAHASMLAKTSIIPLEEADAIIDGLQQIYKEFEGGKFVLDPADEDIHMAVERRLIDIVGPTGGKLHTARSRNDQVATDLRLYMKKQIVQLVRATRQVQSTILGLARRHPDLIMPGFTHLQMAQPVLFAHYIMAYFFMLDRDVARLRCCYKRTDRLPLGAAALAGTSFPIDRDFVARELGFAGVIENSMDAVSDRDFVVEFMSAASLLMVHLGRLSEEIIIMASPPFGFIELDEAFATGSSIMPQKKNPDVNELVRAKLGRVQGHLTAMITTLKALPFGYNRDLQEDKEGLFDTVDTVESCLRLLPPLLESMVFRKEVMEAAASGGFSLATDLADFLSKEGVPFREAHRVTGEIVRYCAERRRELSALTLEELTRFSKVFTADMLEKLRLKESVESRASFGGTATVSLADQLKAAEVRLEKAARWIKDTEPSI